VSESNGLAKDDPLYEQGFRYEGDDTGLLAAALDSALDYRGDVTLLLKGGEELAGYLFNHDRQADDPFVELMPSSGGMTRRVLYRDLRGLSFTGRDTASGKSWETWIRQYEAKKAAEARGEEVESVGLFPEPLD
jgi:hypothetical protein